MINSIDFSKRIPFNILLRQAEAADSVEDAISEKELEQEDPIHRDLAYIQKWTDLLEEGDLSRLESRPFQKIPKKLKKILTHLQKLVGWVQNPNLFLKEYQSCWNDLLVIEETLQSFLGILKEFVEAHGRADRGGQIERVLRGVEIDLPELNQGSGFLQSLPRNVGYLASRLLFPPLFVADCYKILKTAVSVEGQKEEQRENFFKKASDLRRALNEFHPIAANDPAKQKALEKRAEQIQEQEARGGMSETKKKLVYGLFSLLQISSEVIEGSKKEPIHSLIDREVAKYQAPLTKEQEKEISFVGRFLKDKGTVLETMSDKTFEKLTKKYPSTRLFLQKYRTQTCPDPDQIDKVMDEYRQCLPRSTPPWIDLAGAFPLSKESPLPQNAKPAQPPAREKPITESSLSEWLQTPALDANPSLVAHFIGEPFAAGSGLEGYPLEGMVAFMKGTLQQIQAVDEHPASYEKTISHLEKAETLLEALRKGPKELAQKLEAELSHLQAGESFLFPFGWANRGMGHAISFRFQKQQNGSFSLRIFNSGAGHQYHERSVVDSQFFHNRFVEIPDISAKKIASLPFCEALCKMQSIAPFEEWNGVEVYEGLLSVLTGKKTVSFEDLPSRQKPSISKTTGAGFCSFYSIAYWWQEENPEQLARSLIKMESKLYADFRKQGDFSLEENRKLLEKGGEQLARNARAAFERGVITEEAWRLIQSQIRVPLEPAVKSAVLSLESSPFKGDAVIPRLKTVEKNKGLTGHSFDLLVGENKPLDPKHCLQDAIQLHRRLGEEIEKSNHEMIRLAALEWIEILPLLEQEQWKALLTPEEGAALLEQLAEIGKDFAYSNMQISQEGSILYFGDNPAPPRDSLAMIKLLTLGHALSAAFADKGGVLLPRLYQKNMDLLLEGTSGSSHLFDPKQDEELRALRDYWRKAEPIETRHDISFFGFEWIPSAANNRVQYVFNSEGKRWIFETEEGLKKAGEDLAFSKADWSDLQWIEQYIQKPEIADKLSCDPDLAGKPPKIQALILTQKRSGLLPAAFYSLYDLSVLVDFTMRGGHVHIGQNTERKQGIHGKFYPHRFMIEHQEYQAWTTETQLFGEHIPANTYNCIGPDSSHLPDANFPLMRSQDSLSPEHEALYHSQQWIEPCEGITGWSHSRFRTRVSPSSRLTEFPRKLLPFPDDPSIVRFENTKENAVASGKGHPIDLPLQEMREKLALSAIPSLQIRETLAYYQENKELLENREDQILFKKLFFEPLRLNDFFIAHPEEREKLISRFEEFWQTGAHTYADLGKPLVASFYLAIGHLFGQYLSHLNPEWLPPRIDPAAELRTLIHRNLHTPEEAVFLYLDLILIQPHDRLDEEGAVDLLEASVQLKSAIWPKRYSEALLPKGIYPETNYYLNPNYPHEKQIRAKEHLFKLRDALQQLLIGPKRDQILNSFMLRLAPAFKPCSWKGNPQFPFFVTSDEAIYLDVFSGHLYQNGGDRKNLPQELQQHPDITPFLDPEKAPLAFEVAPEVYKFLSKNGEEILAFNNPVSFQKKIQGRWAQKIVPFPSLPLALKEKKSHWLAVDPPDTVWIGEKYKAHLKDSKIEELSRLDTGWRLGTTPPSSSFLSIERPDYILPWLDPATGTLKQVELPRLSLIFDVDEEGHALSREFEGYRISPRQTVAALGDLENYLVLEKGTEKLVLTPAYLRKVEKEKGNLETTSLFQKVENSPLLSYELDRQGNLIPKSASARLYLAYLLLTEQRYDEALENLVGTGSELRALQPLERKILEWMSSTADIVQDSDPRAIALRLKAQLLLMREQEHFSAQGKRKWTESHYTALLQKWEQVPPRFLPTEREEACLARYISDLTKSRMIKGSNFIKNNRKKQQEDEQAILLLEDSIRIAGMFRSGSLIYSIEYDREKPEIHFLRTKTWDQPLLLEAYHCMQEPTEERLRSLYSQIFPKADLPASMEQMQEEIRDSLKLIATSESVPSARAMAALLLAVQEHPGEFPSHSAVNEALKQGINPKTPFVFWADRVLIPAMKTFCPTYLERGDYPLIKDIRPREKAPPSFWKGQSTRLNSSLTVPDVRFESYFTVQSSSPYEQAHQELLEAFSSDEKMVAELQKFASSTKAHPKEFQLVEIEKLERQTRESLLAARDLEERLGFELLKKANRLDITSTRKLYQTNRFLSDEENPIELDELLKLFVTLDTAELHLRNPALSPDECNSLFQKTKEFLIAATQRQHLERALKKCTSAMRAEGTERKRLIQELALESGQRRAYSPEKHPEYLLIEYASNIRLRKEQVGAIERFTPGSAQEAIMGFGKTKVLLPLLALKAADGTNLSMIVMTKDLLPSMAETLDQTLGDAFGRSIDVFQFHRNAPLDCTKLERVYERLENAIQERRVVAMSGSDLQSFFLMAIEAFRNQKPEAKEFRKILALMKKSGHLILDEMHLLLDVFQAHHFSEGDKKFLSPIEMDGAATLFPILCSLGWDGRRAISKEEYEAQWKERMVDQVLLGPEFASYSKQDLKNYLLGKPEGEAFVDPLPSSHSKQLLATLKEQINTLFPLVLAKQIDEHFGEIPFDSLFTGQSKWMAIPYHGSQNPVIGSQFGTTLEGIDYTARLYLAKGVDTEIVEKELKHLQSKIAREKKELGLRSTRETPSYQRFIALAGTDRYSMFHLKKEEIEAIQQNINQNPLLKMELIRSWILPELSTYPKQLFTNGHIFSLLVSSIRGFSGTNWNSQTFPNDFETRLSSDTMAYTLHLLQSKKEPVLIFKKPSEMAQGRSLIDRGAVFKEMSNRQAAKEFLGHSSAKGIVFYENDTLKVLLRNQKEPISYTACSLAKEELIAFWDQKHTTGSDIPLGAEAEAIVTFGRHTHLFELLQAVWRMRGLRGRQKVQFAMLAEEAAFIRNALELEADASLELEHLFQYAWMKERNRGKEHSERALRYKMASVRIAPLLRQMSDETKPLPDPEILDDLFYLEEEEDLYEKYGKIERPIPKEEYVQTLVQNFLSHPWMKTLSSEEQETIRIEIEAIAKEEMPYLPKLISSTSAHYQREVEVQTQTESQKQTEKEQEKKVQAEEDLFQKDRSYAARGVVSWEGPLSRADFLPSPAYDLASVSLTQPPERAYPISSFKSQGANPVVSASDALQQAGFPAIFDEELTASATFLPLQKEATNDDIPVYPYTLFGKHQDIVQETLLIQDIETGQIRMMLLSQDEALQIEERLAKERHLLQNGVRLALYQSGYGLFAQGPGFPTEEQLHADPHFMRLKVQAKFFNGDVSYAKEEIPALEAWLSDLKRKGQFDAAKTLFETKILEWKKKSAETYPDSPLFKRLKAFPSPSKFWFFATARDIFTDDSPPLD